MKLNLTLAQGSTLDQTAFWETEPLVYKAISAVSLAGPVRLTAASHGMLSGARAAVVGVLGTTELNAADQPFKKDDYRIVTVVDVNTVEFNALPGSGLTTYKSGGYLVYNTLKDLSGYTARMTIKRTIGGEVLLALVSPVGIVITTSVQILISATQSAALPAGRWMYDLEMVSAGGVVTKLLIGAFTVTSEVTT